MPKMKNKMMSGSSMMKDARMTGNFKKMGGSRMPVTMRTMEPMGKKDVSMNMKMGMKMG